MTLPPRPTGPTPEQIAAGGPAPNIEVRSQRLVTTAPVPGETVDLVAVTYRIAPNPPQILFFPLEDLPAWVFRKANPGKEVPAAVEAENDAALRTLIRQGARAAPPTPRMI